MNSSEQINIENELLNSLKKDLLTNYQPQFQYLEKPEINIK